MNRSIARSVVVAFGFVAIASSAYARGDKEKGQELATKKYPCTSCHGANFASPIDPSYPKLAGQHADYLRASLLAYQKGDHPTFGRGNAVMAAQAKPLSAQEIDDISAYLASLPPSVVLRR